MISVSIVCLNEASKLENCLKSVQGFADEIVVIDLGSEDQIKKVCEKYQAKLFFQKKVPYVEIIRNYAISKTTGDWILVLDPDETVGENLKNKLLEITKKDEFEAVNIPRKNIFFGTWIKHTNWWPDKQIRFFKKGKVYWDEKIHNYPKVEGKILDLPPQSDLSIIHFGYDSISEFLEKQNRYSEIEAKNLHSMDVKFNWKLFFWKPLRELIVRFIKHAGYLDGFVGLALTFLMMVYQLEVVIKLWELEQ